MEDKEIRVLAESDFLEKVARSKPINALSELIWNSLDADATSVNVQFIQDQLGIQAISISDNGTSLKYSDADHAFSSLGGSEKRQKQKTTNGRNLHGKEGKGRFKAFALGSSVEWKFSYKEDSIAYQYSVRGNIAALSNFHISPKIEIDETCGTVVKISDLYKQFDFLDSEKAVEIFAPIFAPYLISYPDVAITFDSLSINVKSQIRNKNDTTLKSKIIDDSGESHKVELSIFEWGDRSLRKIYFADLNGFPVFCYEKQVRGIAGEYGFSAYLKSDYFSLVLEQGVVELSELDQRIQEATNEAIVTIKNYFIDRYRDDQKDILQSWKDEDSYPFPASVAKTDVEDAERKLFDIVALNLHEFVNDFDQTDLRQKKFQFKLIKQAIENNPSDLKKIIEEVLNLPSERVAELSQLLESTTLSAIISTSSKISNRLSFIKGLEEIVFEPEMKKNLKERTQLHRILADNPWVFGEEYSLSVDDQSLTEVLRKHWQLKNGECIIDEPVKRVDGKVGIIDLMLSRSVPKNHAEEREHLIIELKAPSVQVDTSEVNQIESYALAVVNDERFRGLDVKWDFWVVSSSIGKYAEMRQKSNGLKDGMIFNSNDSNIRYTIRVKTWSQIIQEAKHRHEFVRSQLNLTIKKEDGIEYLRKKYSEYLIGVIDN